MAAKGHKWRKHEGNITWAEMILPKRLDTGRDLWYGHPQDTRRKPERIESGVGHGGNGIA